MDIRQLIVAVILAGIFAIVGTVFFGKTSQQAGRALRAL